jgi:hypothetical protein
MRQDKSVDDSIESSISQAADQDAKIALDNFDQSGGGEGVYICGRTESITDGQQAATFKPWPQRKITFTVITQNVGRLTSEQVVQSFKNAWSSWAKELDIEPTYVTSEAQAMVVSRFGPIDGGGRVLAWSELSNGTMTQKHQLYDTNEQWVSSETPSGIDLDRVAAHEIGHVLGLVHDSDNSGSLRAPMYNRAVRWPTARDYNRMIELGYRRAAEVTPPSPPGLPRLIPIVATVDESALVDALRKAGWKVER